MRSRTHLNGPLLTLLCLAVLLLAPAQPAAAQGSLYVFPTEGAVHLRWNAPLERGYDGFHVERRRDGGDWERLTASPVTRIDDVEAIRLLMGRNASAFLTFFPQGTTRIDDAAFGRVMGDETARGLIGLLSVKEPLMGEVLGEVYRDRNLQPGSEFDYRVLLLSGGTESVWAESAAPVEHGRPAALAVPSGFRGDAGDASALLGWDHDKSRSRSGELVGYRVYRSESPGGEWQLVSDRTIIPTAVGGKLPEYLFVDTYLENGRPYWYRLSGMNVLGFESARSEAVKVVPRDSRPPPPPGGFGYQLRAEGVLLRWDPVTVPDLAGYRVYRSQEEPAGPFEQVWPARGEPELPVISYGQEMLPEGVAYWYYATAVDLSGNESRPSALVQVFREDRTPPPRVTGLDAVAVDEGKFPGVHLTWQPVEAPDLRGYIVERTTRVSGSGPGQQIEDRYFGENIEPLTDTGFIDPVPITSQSRYAYRVVAVDRAWNRSEPSEPVVARMPDKVPPNAPSLLYARMDEGNVLLRWVSNTEEDLAGYRLFRGESADGLRPLSAEIPAVLTEFRDSPPVTGRTYHYALTALDGAGNESERSGTLSVLYRDTSAPEPPAITSVEPAADGLALRWSLRNPAGIRTQIIYRRGPEDPEPAIIAYLHEGEEQFLDPDVESGQTYTYYIRVTDESENLSGPGKPASATAD